MQMADILSIIREYTGNGSLFILYLPALVCLLVREKDRVKKALLVYLPLAVIVVFLLPPVYSLYRRVEEAATYYRFLWMVPAGMTIVYAAVSLSKKYLLPCLVAAAILICCFGSCVYSSRFIAPAENRLHLPQAVIDISDYLIANSEGSENVTIAVPGELIHFVRQYDCRLRLAFGREAYVEGWSESNPVYEEMELYPAVNAARLSEAARQYKCNFIVINAAREMEGDLRDEGYDLMALLDGYYIYRDPGMPFQY